MDEEQKQLRSAPPRYRYLILKAITLTVLFLAIFGAIGYSGLEATSSSKFCASCHEMKPEYYTLKASSHAEVDCIACHTDPVFKNLAKDKAVELIDQYKKDAVSSVAPIRLPNDIPNSACEKCHNMKTREVTPSEDLIIPHEKHLQKGVKCVECHSGVAHGDISDRKMTYQTDIDKWDQTVGTQAMADLKYTRPNMDTCLECHKARDVSTACATCHKTGMKPVSHNDPNFKKHTHGNLAGKDIAKCDECHGLMTDQKIDGIEQASPLDKILNSIQSTKPSISQFDYAKANTFCKKCHSLRPASHSSTWVSDHGKIASKDTTQCLACHNYQQTGQYDTTTPACSSCHPSIHEGFNKVGHPIPLAPNQKITKLCYTCHVKNTCSSCHRDKIMQ